jgi:cyclohexanecarboxylate-CoA ligase
MALGRDLAIIDERGYVTITGRIKEMINRGGESISATEIERLIRRHPDVAAVVLVPMPDPDMGERVYAYIQPKTRAETNVSALIQKIIRQDRKQPCCFRSLRLRNDIRVSRKYFFAH